jgi:hypothetical protein
VARIGCCHTGPDECATVLPGWPVSNTAFTLAALLCKNAGSARSPRPATAFPLVLLAEQELETPLAPRRHDGSTAARPTSLPTPAAAPAPLSNASPKSGA